MGYAHTGNVIGVGIMTYRVSTLQYYKRNTDFINTAYQNVLAKQGQIASGKKVQTPSDDPIAAARINLLKERLDKTERYSKNADSAQDALSNHDSNVGSMMDMVARLKALQIQAGNGGYTLNDRQALAIEVRGMLDQLVSLANSKDASGRYIYGGGISDTKPITLSGDTYVYNGDDSQRKVDISSGLQIASSDTGYDLFMNIANGSGDFTTSTGFTSALSTDPEYAFRDIGLSDHTNTGTKTITDTSIYDRDLYLKNTDTYFVKFDTSGSPTTYSVYDSDGQTVVSAANYTDGTPIQFNGIEVTFDSTNALGNGDIYSLRPNSKQSIFETVQNMLTNLGQNPLTDEDKQVYNNQRQGITFQLDQILNHFSTIQASVGSRMQSITRAQETNDEIIFSSQSTISQLEDIDIAQAASELSGYSFSLQAAQQSFARIQDLSLFNFLR